MKRGKINRRTDSRGAGRCRNSYYQVCPDGKFSRRIWSPYCQEKFTEENNLMKLNPKVADDGVLRCGGHLKYAENLPYDVRFLVILARKSWVTKLIVKHYHEQDNHVSGTDQMLASLSTR